MNPRNRWLRPQTVSALVVVLAAGLVWTTRARLIPPAYGAQIALDPSFEQTLKPFLKKNCVACHNADNATAGVRVDQLDGSLDDRHIKLWEAVQHRVGNGTMPPKGMPQPSAAERKPVLDWIARGLNVARLRPSPLNGNVRRLTVAQYRNTLRELLRLDDDLTEILPPDAVSRDGFVNNKDTLQLSPLLMEAYLEIAEEGLKRSIVDPNSKPSIQNFRVDLGAGINPAPIPDKLILGAGSLLLENKDVLVTQLTPKKPFPFDPFFMRTKYRFIEGYAGNDTVRGWREYDSIYHSVFADMRGSVGYPKGNAYGTVPEGLLLRPAIPNDEIFDDDGTYGPKANFKLSLRELPDNGRFRVTVTAAKYDDGLLLDPGTPEKTGGVTISPDPKIQRNVTIPKPGIYQVDVHLQDRKLAPLAAPDASRLSEALAGPWPAAVNTGKLEKLAKLVDSPFGPALSMTSEGDDLDIPRTEAMNVGDGDFTVALWARPRTTPRGGLISLGAGDGSHGWHLALASDRGVLRLQTNAVGQANGTVAAPRGTIVAGEWQHIAAIVRRGKGETTLFVNGYPVAKGDIGRASLDNLKANLHLGRVQGAGQFRGELSQVRIYRRAIDESELQALVQPGRKFVKAPPEKPQDITLNLGSRQFIGKYEDPAFLVVRLPAGDLPVTAGNSGVRNIDRIAFTPLAAGQPLAKEFEAFEKRSPLLGVQLGLRRDCGSTFAPAGAPQPVPGTKLAKYVFEGAIRNFPSPDVEKDNVNYLAGVREIAVHSEYTDGRDMPRMVVRSVEFEGPFYETWPPPSHKSIFVDSPRKSDPAAYAKEIVRHFATRAYRRPVTAAEETALMDVYQKSFAANGGKFRESITDVLEVVLTSPQFLFLIETSASPAPEPVNNTELASKLSYFLWNGPPDEATQRLAATGTLRKHLNSEVDRMLVDPRASRFFNEFTAQWLSLDKFQVLEPDRKRFPELSRFARSQLKDEPVQFVRHLILNNLPARNLISSDFVMANETVANYYHLSTKVDSGLRFVAVPHADRPELGGVLTQASIMAGLSDGRESNPVKRGAWLARKIVSEPPADPPPNVPALKEDASEKLTLRQRIERHRSQPGCVQCHLKIDPWGVAFEEFDAAGLIKKEPVDAHSKLPDNTEVDGIKGLKRYLADDRIDQVAFSVLKNLTTYATGRSLSYYEQNFLKQDALQLKAGGYRMKDMIHYVVNSKLFLEK